jgi:predicted flap endonuclease-1-like 5' DNA nuclease
MDRVLQERDQTQIELGRLRAQLAKLTAEDEQLERIRGIGKVIAERLRAAGVRTLADLAELDPERARTISGLKQGQLGDPAGWIAQARELVNRA